jgi:hypothetical protein
MRARGFGRTADDERRRADLFYDALTGTPARRRARRWAADVPDTIEAYDPGEQQQPPPPQPPPAAPQPYLPTGGRNFVPVAGTFNCSPPAFTVVPASFLPTPTTNANAAIDGALTTAGLSAAQRGRIARAGLVPIAAELGQSALTELFARLRWSAADIVAWGRGANDMLVQRLLLHIPGHFRELARRAPDMREAFLLECLGWLLMAELRGRVTAATRTTWWIPPAPSFVTAVPNPMPPMTAEVARLFTRHLWINTTMTGGQWNAQFSAWASGLPGRQWHAETLGPSPGRPFYAGLVTVPAHVNTAAATAAFGPAWTRRVTAVDALHAPHAAGAGAVTLAGLQNAVELRRCDNAQAPAGAFVPVRLQGLEFAFGFPLQQGGTTLRQLNVMAQLQPVYTALFSAIRELGWNDLLYSCSGAACFRGVKHKAAARVTIGGVQVSVNPFEAPTAAKVVQINTHFTPAQRARVVAASRTARTLSDHGLGAALDFNVLENDQDIAARPFGSMDPRVVAIFEAFHFRWGGCFGTTDPMHFDYCQAACAPAAAAAGPAPAVPRNLFLPMGAGPVIA